MSFKTFFPTNVCRTEKQYAAAEKLFNENKGTGYGITGNPFVPKQPRRDEGYLKSFKCKFAFCFRSENDLVYCHITPGGKVCGLNRKSDYYPI